MNKEEQCNTETTHQAKLQNNLHTTHQNQSHSMEKRSREINTPQLHNGIILSHFNQSSSIFTSPGQGLQCVANCIMSIIYHKHKDCINWKSLDIKNILYSGNVLYNTIGKFTTILVCDLPRHIKLYNNIYNIQEINSIIGNIFQDNHDFNTLSFDKCENVIVKYKYMILILGSSSLSIIYSGNIFYTFDPHKRNTYGLPDSSGGAAVLRFNSFNQLCLYIYQLSHHLHTTDYELTPITVKKYSLMDNRNKTQKLNERENIQTHNSETINVINCEKQTNIFNKQISQDNKSQKTENETNTTVEINEINSRNLTDKNTIFHSNNSNNETKQPKKLSQKFENVNSIQQNQIEMTSTNSQLSSENNISHNNNNKKKKKNL